MARLDIAKIVVGAFVVPWWQRRAFCRALAIPFVMLLALTTAQQVAFRYFVLDLWPLKFAWLFYVVFGLILALFTVTCHRVVLLEPQTPDHQFDPIWARRVTRFALWMLALWLLWLAVVPCALFFLAFIFAYLPSSAEEASRSLDMFAVAEIPAFYLFTRFCLVFPATAIDRKPSLKWAWSTSRECSWRLFLIIAVFPWIAFRAIGLLYRDNPSLIETIGLSAFGYILLVIPITALSLSYGELARDASLDVHNN